MGGLAVATLLTLVFLPALYVAWFGIKRPRAETRQRIDLRQPATVGA
jgi:multidrug efflux pump